MNKYIYTLYGEAPKFASQNDLLKPESRNNWIWEILEGEAKITDDGCSFLRDNVESTNFVEDFFKSHPEMKTSEDFLELWNFIYKSGLQK